MSKEIEELKKQIEELKARIAQLESRPIYVAVPYPVPTYIAPPVLPPYNPWPLTPNFPYITC